MAFLKNDKLMIEVDEGRFGQILHFLGYLLRKITSGLKNSPEYVFWLKNSKIKIESGLKPTGIKL